MKTKTTTTTNTTTKIDTQTKCATCKKPGRIDAMMKTAEGKFYHPNPARRRSSAARLRCRKSIKRNTAHESATVTNAQGC
jgi:hypothetical protein